MRFYIYNFIRYFFNLNRTIRFAMVMYTIYFILTNFYCLSFT